MNEKYFDAQLAIEGYEEDTGNTASTWLKSVIKELEPIVNRAYSDGFSAGMEAANV